MGRGSGRTASRNYGHLRDLFFLYQRGKNDTKEHKVSDSPILKGFCKRALGDQVSNCKCPCWDLGLKAKHNASSVIDFGSKKQRRVRNSLTGHLLRKEPSDTRQTLLPWKKEGPCPGKVGRLAQVKPENHMRP